MLALRSGETTGKETEVALLMASQGLCLGNRGPRGANGGFIGGESPGVLRLSLLLRLLIMRH